MLLALFQSIIDGFAALLSVIITVFPRSPFTALSSLTVGNDLLATLAWFVPFPQIIGLLEAWGLAIGVYYCWLPIARWIKLLE